MKPVTIQRNIALLSVVLFLAKIFAWYLTGSVTVLTDALEGIVNMIAGFLGLFSITLAAMPRDTNHPYGHGKAEFLSSAVEGTLIVLSGFVIIFEAIQHLLAPHPLQKLDMGLLIVAAAGGVNFLAGKYAENKGKKNNSMILESAGKHLQTDAWSTVAIIIGLLLIILTGNRYQWLDGVVALCFACIIMITGYKVLRRSISGIMDEMDVTLLKEVIALLQASRKPQWIDLHNLRVIQYGNLMHVDAHMTMPWYYTVNEADNEIQQLEKLIKSKFGSQVELFIHIDGCKDYQCRLCAMENCKVRKAKLDEQMEWVIDNVWANAEHGKGAAH
jgi:cation diffusion facilitator family transporter